MENRGQVTLKGMPPLPKLEGLSIVLPCLNEEANVASAIDQAVAAGRRFSSRYEVIVVDDGSTDRTAIIAARRAARERGVHLVMHPANRGYGAALRSGIDMAQMEWVMLTDADLQFDLAQLEEFVPFAGSHDVIAGYRIARRDPFGRRANAAAWNWLMRHLFGLPLQDVDCAFKLIRRNLITDLELVSSGAMISTELIVKSLQRGARLKEVGVHHRPRPAGEQSGANPRVIWLAFRELSKVRAGLPPATTATS
jgi:glycosyltransferase involved in cell wall biosynthesis